MSSPLARDLLQAARGDRPGAAQRSRIWEAVASAPEVSIAAAGTGTALMGSKAFGGLSAGKLVLLGALAGSLATAGVGSWLVRSASHAELHAEATRPVLSVAREQATKPTVVELAPAGVAETAAKPTMQPQAQESVAVVAVPVPRHVSVGAVSRASVVAPVSREDALMREAALVSEARTLVVSGQAGSALELLDAAAKGTSHSLEPEMLSLRSRALRALGRDAEAEQADEMLRHRYPDHFLAR
jgi:hypothetical protein